MRFSCLYYIIISYNVVNGEFVDIDNATYFFEIVTGFHHRDDAKTTCESLNMTMIRFEGEEQKWLAIKEYLTKNGKFLKISLCLIKKYLYI